MQSKTHHKQPLHFGQTAILLLTLVIASGISLWQRTQLNFSAGHMDEYDYLFVAKTLLAGHDWPTHTYIFGSDFSWYLFGWGERLFGGLSGARTMAAALGLLSLLGAYLFARELWQCKRTAAIATLLLAVSAEHIFISRLASYDSVSFALFCLAMMPLLRGARRHNTRTAKRELVYLNAGMFLLLSAVLTKYTTAAYLPVIALLLLHTSIVRALYFGSVMTVGIALYVGFHWTDLQTLYNIQINGIHGANTTRTDIIYRTLYHTGLPLALTILALLRSHKDKNNALTLIVLVALACPLFIYHLHGRNLISLYKHLNFSLLFLTCGAAWWLAKMVDISTIHLLKSRKEKLAPFFVAIVVALYCGLNSMQLKTLESGFPNVQSLLQYLKDNPIASDATVLSEDPYLFRYLQFDKNAQHQLKETTWLDNNNDGIHSHDDVVNALSSRSFDLVLLTDAIHPAYNRKYRPIIRENGYQPVYTEPYQLTPVMSGNQTGTLTLYRRTALYHRAETALNAQ